MDQSVGQILLQARRQTDNEGPTSTSGISTEELLYYINEAQDRLESLITAKSAHVFDTTSTISVAANTQAYNLPADMFIDNRVEMVEWSHNGLTKNYRVLPKLRREELSNAAINTICGYDIRNGQILISPIPTSAKGTLRITYQRRLDNLDIKRATVASSADDGTDFTAITIEDDTILADNESYNETALSDATTPFLCINSPTGTVNYYNIEYASYNVAGKLITLASGQALTGGSISPGDIITFGKYTTIFSDLPDIAMRYLLNYVVWNILKRESSVDAQEQLQELAGIAQDIIETYGKVTGAVETIPILNDFYGV